MQENVMKEASDATCVQLSLGSISGNFWKAVQCKLVTINHHSQHLLRKFG